MTFESDYDAVLAVRARRDRLDAAIAAMAADSEFIPIVRRLGCLRGVATLAGFALADELGDWHRFTGNTHVRKLLIESAWHHRAHQALTAAAQARPAPWPDTRAA